MTELSIYQKFNHLTRDENLRRKVDPYIQYAVEMAENQGKDPDIFYVPMLIDLEQANVDLRDCTKVLSVIGSIVAVRSTIPQLIELLQHNGVKYLEGSRPTSIEVN